MVRAQKKRVQATCPPKSDQLTLTSFLCLFFFFSFWHFRADIALIGLAVMGQNLILNMNDHGFVVSSEDTPPSLAIGHLFFRDLKGSDRASPSVSPVVAYWSL